MSKYTTITVSESVKKRLEKFKGRRSWDDFLNSLLDDYLKLKRIIAAMRLEKIGFPEIGENEVKSRWKFKEIEL